MTRLAKGNLGSERDLFASFSAATLEAAGNLRGEEVTVDPPEEKIAFIKLEKLTIVQDGVDLRIRVGNKAGQRLSQEIPIRFVIN